MENERLNYKECREKVSVLLDKSSILSREDIAKALGISVKSLVYTNPYYKFRNFLNNTRKYAYREYAKSKDERISISNMVFFREIINRDKKSLRGFIQFCGFERIPLLYYVWQIKKYIFPNEFILPHIHTIKFVMYIKTWIKILKNGESWGFYRNVDDIINKKIYTLNANSLAYTYMTNFIKANYIFGEPMEKMFERLEYDEITENMNKLIEDNLYTITDLELRVMRNNGKEIGKKIR